MVGPTAQVARSLLPLASVKMMFACLPEGVAIDTPEGARTIESLRAGDSVIGFSGSPVRILQKHEYHESGDLPRFLRVDFDNGSSVRLCDMHRINGIRAKALKPGDRVSGHTIDKITWYGGVRRSYDLLTEDAGYQIGCIPVNSMIDEMLDARAEPSSALAPSM